MSPDEVRKIESALQSVGKWGDILYAQIMSCNPQLERKYWGRTIWIDTECKIYALGEGLDGAKALARAVGMKFHPQNPRLGWNHGNHFYSRPIGTLPRMPFA